MRHQGTIVSWDLGRGIGAILWHGGDERVFVRITDFPDGDRRPEIGDIVSYYRGEDDRGRPVASVVEFARPAGQVAAPVAPARNLQDRTDVPAPPFARDSLHTPITQLPSTTILLVLALVVVLAWAAWNWF